jgi:mono/diheme cytochrome c family protein
MARKRVLQPVVWAVILVTCAAPAVLAQSAVAAAVSGRATFDTYCATCHGTSAKGDGPLASSMRRRPADLTRIAARNGGTFAPDEVTRIIDGRNPVRGHGGGDMPVWGDAFAKSIDPLPAEEKIGRLVRYLESIQIKP